MGRTKALRTLFLLARKVGPLLVITVVRNWPRLSELARANPTALQNITARFRRTSRAGGDNPTSRKGLAGRTSVLKDQVTYLYASANTPQAAKDASRWRAKLDAIERLLPLLDAMSLSQRRAERRRISKRIDSLSQEIMAASLIDDIEDAEIDGQENPPEAL